LIDVKGTLYGTTTDGGTYHKGTLYSVTLNGTENVLHSFGGSSDGANPLGGLIEVNGTLYGTTVGGGAGEACPSSGCGTVYAMTTSGNESVLYTFAGGSDGLKPQSGLIDVKGTLYGTTRYGGGGECQGQYAGCGTVYSISTSGSESVLYSFAGGTDGMYPQATVLEHDGTLYGTTAFGGTPRNKPANCCGTVFALTP
jgi:uncharacterized repeat protein (TIGR03803 family)